VTTDELISYDFGRTIIYYDDYYPHNIVAIMILKEGVILSQADENRMRDDFRLSIWWNDTLSLYGYIKENRGIGKSYWVNPEYGVTDNLFSLWEFDELTGTTALDSYGGNNLTLNGVTVNQIGKFNKAFSFDGNDTAMSDITGISAFPFTLSAWIKATPTGSAQSIINIANKNSNAAACGISIDTDGYGLIYNYNTSYFQALSTTIIADGTWHHITGVFESNTSKKLYIDGNLENTLTDLSTIPSIINRVAVGVLGRTSLTSYLSSGLVDEPAIFTEALVQTKIDIISIIPYKYW
jgi:hypothetical protein